MATKSLDQLIPRAEKAADGLKALAHQTRLLAICFIGKGEKSVGELEKLLGISQSNLSQHLAILKRQGLLETRREANQIFYRVSNTQVLKFVSALQDLYC